MIFLLTLYNLAEIAVVILGMMALSASVQLRTLFGKNHNQHKIAKILLDTLSSRENSRHGTQWFSRRSNKSRCQMVDYCREIRKGSNFMGPIADFRIHLSFMRQIEEVGYRYM